MYLISKLQAQSRINYQFIIKQSFVKGKEGARHSEELLPGRKVFIIYLKKIEKHASPSKVNFFPFPLSMFQMAGVSRHCPAAL